MDIYLLMVFHCRSKVKKIVEAQVAGAYVGVGYCAICVDLSI